MNSRAKARMLSCSLAWTLTGWATGTAAQNCSERIDSIKTIGDVQSAINCVQGLVAAEARARQDAEKNLKQLPQQVAEQIELVTSKVRHASLKESTNGLWKQIPDSADADACFLSSVRLPPQGLCQVTHQGDLGRWAYNASDIAGAGFVCTATCVWLDVRPKAAAAQ